MKHRPGQEPCAVRTCLREDESPFRGLASDEPLNIHALQAAKELSKALVIKGELGNQRSSALEQRRVESQENVSSSRGLHCSPSNAAVTHYFVCCSNVSAAHRSTMTDYKDRVTDSSRTSLGTSGTKVVREAGGPREVATGHQIGASGP